MNKNARKSADQKFSSLKDFFSIICGGIKRGFKFLCRHYVELILVLLIVVIIIVEETCFINIRFVNDDGSPKHIIEVYQSFCTFLSKGNFFVNNIISILCPLIPTVLSISISVYSDDIFGAKMSTIRKYRKHNKYSLLGMILIPIACLCIVAILFYFDLLFSMLIVNLVSLVYCIVFLCLEIPLLSKSDRSLLEIINNIVIETANDYESSVIENKDLMHNAEKNTLLKNVVFKWGIKKYLDQSRTQASFNMLNVLLQSSTGVMEEYEGLSDLQKLKVIPQHIQNICEYLLGLYHNVDAKTAESYNLNDVFYVARSINVVIEKIGLDKLKTDYRPELDFIISTLFSNKQSAKIYNKNINIFLIAVSNTLMVTSLKNHNLWYFDCCSYIYSETLIDKSSKDETYFSLMSLYLFYARMRSDDNVRLKIDGFIKDKWIDTLHKRRYVFSSMLEDEYIQTLKSILEYYSYSKNMMWSFSSESGHLDQFFDETYIISLWTIGIFSVTPGIGKDFITKLQMFLTEDEMTTFARVFEDFVDLYDQKNNCNYFVEELVQYFPLFNQHLNDPKTPYSQNNYVKPVNSFIKNELSSKRLPVYENALKNVNVDKDFLSNLQSTIELFPFYRGNPSALEKNTKMETLEIANSIITILSIETLELRFDSLLRNSILDSADKFFKSSTKNKDDQQILYNVIKNFGKDTQVDDLISGDHKYNNLINLYIDFKEKPIIRFLNDMEINKIIEDEYKPKDGLYVYNIPDSSINEPLYLTYNQLFKLISEDRRFVSVSFEYCVQFDFDNMFKKVEDK